MDNLSNNSLQKNQVNIQNNHTICYICQKEISLEDCKIFSCNHYICIICIAKLIIRENFNFWLIDDFKERDYIKASIKCFCGKGDYSSDTNTLQKELKDSILIKRPKEIKCHKHFENATNFCSNCQKEICDKCIEDHEKDLLKNKNMKKHDIIKIEKCKKPDKNNLFKDDISLVQNNINEAKKSFNEFSSDEEHILIDEIDRIIKSLNEIKSYYINSFKEKTAFINKILDFIFITYNAFYKEKDCDISELSMNNCKLIEGITDSFHKIDYIPKSLNYCEKVMKEIEKAIDNKSLLDFEYKFEFNYIKFISHQELVGHKNAVNCLCVLQDRYIASGSSDHTIKIWDSLTDQKKIKPIKTLDFHVDIVNSIIDIDKGNYIISSGRDDKLCLWDMKEIIENKNIIDKDNIVYDEKKIFPKKYKFSESIVVYSLCNLSNGNIVISGRDESIKIVDKELKKIDIILKKNTGSVLSAAEFSNGILISGGVDGKVKLWDLNKKKCLDIYKGHKGQINSIIKIRYQNDLFFSGSSDSIISILSYKLNPNLNSKIELIGKLEGHKGPVYCLLELLDGRIASGSTDCTIKIWNIKDKTCMQTILGHRSTVFSLAQLNDGRLISGEADKLIYIHGK